MTYRISFTAAAFATAVAGFSLPASAQGFFDSIFGGGPAQQSPPAYASEAPPAYGDAPIIRPRARKKVTVALSEKPKLQRPTDIMHDKTLENGDAVMTKEGLRLYVGDDGAAVHDKGDFAGIDAVDNLPKEGRKALVAMEATRFDPLRGSVSPDSVSSGRSAAIATPVVAGREIVDARGSTVRYVGP